jgi:ketosteroid isomerase-like protein
MYKAIVRMMVRRNVAQLNAGNATPMLKMASPDIELRFPGDNSWSTMFRPVVKGRAAHATHRGLDECRAFADRFAANGIQFELEDILVNGGPWNTRVAMRLHSFLPAADGDRYNNRAVAVLELKWGKLVAWEDYEDTERVAAWDAQTTSDTV